MTKPHRLLRIAAPWIPVLWGIGLILLKSFPDYPPGNDSCLYLTMAKGFAAGTGYHDITSPDPLAGTLQSPSAWPLLLSAYWHFPGAGLAALRLANALLLGSAAVPCFFWLRFFLPAIPAFLIAMAFVSSWITVFLGNSFMTETLFTPLLYGGLWLSHTGSRDAKGAKSAKGAGFARWAALLIWTVMARTRVVGWFFWAAYMLLLGRGKEWGKLAAGAALMAAWLLLERGLAAGIRVTHYQDGVFTSQYPLLVNLKLGLLGLLGNLKATAWGWATAGQGHALFPWFYYAHPMDKAKRLACAAIFLAVLWGLGLAWRRHRDARPWILAALAANLPTFLIFHPGDSWRYLYPFLPFSCLFLVLAAGNIHVKGHVKGEAREGGSPLWMGLAGLLLVFSQAMHSYQRNMDDDYIDQSRDFRALHDSLLASPVKPALILSPDHYYTWLRTGIPSMNDYGRQHRLPQVIPYLKDREVWAIRGSANAYYVEPWERAGVVFVQPPVLAVRQWQALKAEWKGQ